MGVPGFDFADRAAVWDEFRRVTAGRPCDMTGITAERLQREKNMQWPCPADDHPGTKRRYLDHVFPTPNGRAKLISHPPQLPKEPTDREFPLVLTTGRIYAHWHTLTRTGKVDKLLKRDPEPYVEVHPLDAERLGSRRRPAGVAAKSSRDGLPAGAIFRLGAPRSVVRTVSLGRLVGRRSRRQLS